MSAMKRKLIVSIVIVIAISFGITAMQGSKRDNCSATSADRQRLFAAVAVNHPELDASRTTDDLIQIQENICAR